MYGEFSEFNLRIGYWENFDCIMLKSNKVEVLIFCNYIVNVCFSNFKEVFRIY